MSGRTAWIRREIYEPDGWDGYFKQAFYCEECQKMLIDIAAEE